MNSVSRLIVPSESSKAIMMQNGVKSEKIGVLPLFAANTFDIEPAPYPRKNGHLLFLGRLRSYKGVRYLLEAVAKIHPVRETFILGDGEERKELETLCAKLGLAPHVHFLGKISHEETTQHFKQAAAVVVPSIYADSFPTVGLEAMARARPVIGFRIGGIPEWLDDGVTGFLVKTQNAEELAEKIRLVFEKPDLGQALGLNGRKRFEERFTAAGHLDRLTRIYQEAIASFSSRKTSAL